MTHASHRYTAALSSLLIAASFWLPTAASLSDAASASRFASQHHVVSATTSPIVLM